MKSHIAIEKAKSINEDTGIYGTFAEIGAGQEVARFFFQAGQASKTIAKTMSAYDMKFSDAIYGPEKSYVCHPRVNKMLEKEYDLLEERLTERKIPTRFFVFADTVATGSKRRNTAGHGWVGVKFQHEVGAKPSKVILHIRLLGKSNIEQQVALGKVGVNLVHACFNSHENPGELIRLLSDDVDINTIEIDSIRMTGPCFDSINNRMMQIELVKKGLSSGVMFNSKGHISSPSELLYKKHVVAIRGTFRPITTAKAKMLETARETFSNTIATGNNDTLAVCEISTDLLYQSGDVDKEDFLARVDMLAGLGYAVLVSSYKDDFSLVEYLNRYSPLSRALVLGTHNLNKILDKNSYKHLVGGLLEALGLMLSHNTYLFLYPIMTHSGMLNVEDVKLSDENKLLLDYLMNSGLVKILENKTSDLYISPSEVCELIKEGKEIDNYVPESVVTIVKDRCLYQG